MSTRRHARAHARTHACTHARTHARTHTCLYSYYLEFEGRNTFLQVWMAGCLFTLVNVALLAAVVKSSASTWPTPTPPPTSMLA